MDLHPDDLANRQRLAQQLLDIRETAGISAGRLAAILGYRDHAGVRQMERRATWQVGTVQRWARALGHRLTLTINSLTIPNDGDVLAAMYAATLADPNLPPARADLLLLRQVVNDLARIRRSMMSAPAFGRLIGLDDKSVLWRETNPDGARLSSLQRVARGLGGSLTPGLTPVSTSTNPASTSDWRVK